MTEQGLKQSSAIGQRLAPACQAEGTLESTRLMADLARRAALLWLDLRSDSSRTAPSAAERSRLERYNAEHLGFVRKDPDNSVRRALGCEASERSRGLFIGYAEASVRQMSCRNTQHLRFMRRGTDRLVRGSAARLRQRVAQVRVRKSGRSQWDCCMRLQHMRVYKSAFMKLHGEWTWSCGCCMLRACASAAESRGPGGRGHAGRDAAAQQPRPPHPQQVTRRAAVWPGDQRESCMELGCAASNML